MHHIIFLLMAGLYQLCTGAPEAIPGYKMTPNKYCYVKNEGGQVYGLMLQECADKCNNLAGCVSFEFFTDLLDAGHVGETLCQPSTTCTLDISVDFPDESTRGPIYFYSVDSVPLDGRDCSVLAIDEFLLQCSSDYPTQ
eukprot:232105_1